MSRKLRLFVDQEQSDAVVAEFNRYDRIIPMSLSREMLYCWVMDTIVHAVNNVIAEVPWEWPALGDYIPESIADEIDMFCDNVAAGIHSHAPHEEYIRACSREFVKPFKASRARMPLMKCMKQSSPYVKTIMPAA